MDLNFNNTYDAVVVGLGGSGSSALYHLSKTGSKVLGIEKFQFPHANGSSHGDTRIIRQAYFEGGYYVPFVKRAYELWSDLEEKSNTKLFMRTGCLNISNVKDNLVGRCKQVSDLHQIKYNLLKGSEVNKKYPFFNIPEGYDCLEEEDAGLLLPEKCIEAHLTLAKNNKAEILFNTSIDIITFHKNENLYHLKSNSDPYLLIKSKSLILSAGSWMNTLLSNFNISLPLTIDLNYVYYFRFKEQLNKLPIFPVYLISYDADNEFYGFPDIDNGNGFKISMYKQQVLFDKLENLDRNCQKQEVHERLTKHCKQFIAGFSEDRVEYIKDLTCLYTSTPDKDFIIDYLPSHERVVIVSACSGHGFKFTSRIGEHAVNLLNKKEVPIKQFRLSRFCNKF